MAIFTPRGLKIRLDNRYCFALMQRVYPKVSPYKILKTTEGFELIKDVYILFAVIVSTYLINDYWIFGIIIFCFSVLDSIVEQFAMRGTYMSKYNLLLNAAIIYSYIDGYLIYTSFVCFISYSIFDWYGIAAYFSAKILATLFNWILGIIEAAVRHKQNIIHLQTLGMTLTKSERNFLNSYLLYSKEKEIPLQLNERELKKENYRDVYNYLQYKWPVITSRFTDDN